MLDAVLSYLPTHLSSAGDATDLWDSLRPAERDRSAESQREAGGGGAWSRRPQRAIGNCCKGTLGRHSPHRRPHPHSGAPPTLSVTRPRQRHVVRPVARLRRPGAVLIHLRLRTVTWLRPPDLNPARPSAPSPPPTQLIEPSQHGPPTS